MKKLSLLLTIFLSLFIAAPSVVLATDYTVSFISDVTIAEGGGTAAFSVTLNTPIADGDTVTVDYITSNGTALPGSDFGTTSGTLSFNTNGDQTKPINVTILNDTIVELDETFFADLSNLNITTTVGSTVVFADNQGECTISNDDSYSISIDDVTHAEGNAGTTTYTFTVSVDQIGDTDVSVDYSTGGGTAVPGTDYSATNGTVTVIAGNLSNTIDVDVSGDTLVEGVDTFNVTIANVAGGPGTISDDTGVGTITNDDSYSISIDDVTNAEGDAGTTTYTFTVSVDQTGGLNVTVDYATGGGTATAGTDYVATSGNVTITSGSISNTFDVTVTGDTVLEFDETFDAVLTGVSSGPGTIIDDTGIGTITDDDSASVSIAANDASAAEPADDGQFTVTITNPSSTDTVISYTVAGDATAGSDYTALSGSVTISANATTATIDVELSDDNLVEDNETVTVTLTGITNGDADITIGAPNSDTVTISDDDSATVSIAATDAAAAEPGDDGEFTVSISNQSDTATVISYTVAGGATAGSDYTTLTGSVTILANSTTGTIEVEVNDDNLVEDNETVTVTLASITSGDAEISIDGANNEDTVTITDDDTATFTINDQTVNEAAGTMTLTVSLDSPLDIAVDVGVTYGGGTATGGGTDYDSTADQVTFAAGDTGDKEVTVAITEDILVEATETFTASLATATALGTRSTSFSDTGTGTITDNDTASVSIVANDAAAAEPANDGQFTVTMTNQSDTDTVVNYNVTGNATPGGDYVTLSGSVTISANANTATIDVGVLDDNLVEGNETVTVDLTSIASGDADISIDGANNSDTVTIADDGDTYDVSITSVSPNPVPEADTTVTITVELSNVDINGVVGTVNVSYATSDSGANPATAGSDYTSASGSPLVFTSATGPTVTVDVPIINDDLLESDETFDFTLSAFTGGGSITGTNPETVTINDDTDKCGISIDSPVPDHVNEGNSITFTVTINQVVPALQTVTVQYETTDDTAVAEGAGAGDYEAISISTLTFVAGEGPGDVKQITVQTNDDNVYEIQEHFTVDLSNQSPNAAIIIGQGDGYIDDDGDTYDVSIEAAEAIIEGTDATVTFTVTLDQEVPGGTSVSFTLDDVTAMLGSDYSENTPVPTLNFAADETTKDVVVNIANDDLYEVPETFEVNITCADPNSTLSNGKGTCTINDDGIDKYNVSITAVSIPDPVLEADTTVIFTVTLDQEVPGGASVNFSLNDVTATLNSDYSENIASPLNFAPNETTKDIIVNILNDQVDEDSETFEVIITTIDPDAILVNDTGSCTINDNDYTVTFNIATVGPAGIDGGRVNGVLSLDQVVDHGTDCVPVTAAPIALYRFVEWTGDYNGTANPLTITNVTSDMTITANFIAIYTITATSGANGTISPSGAVIVDYETDQTFIFDPNTCYEVDDVVVDGSSIGGEIRNYTFTNVTADHDIDVQFYHYDCTITATAEHGGTITPSGAVTVSCGSNQSFTISAGMGNEIAEVLVDGVDLGIGTGIITYNHNWTNIKKDDDDTSPCVHYIVAKFTRPALSCMDISDVPLNAMSRSAPANIMFVLDDSGSMDWEFITDESDGLFSGEYYVFNNPGDNLYSDWNILSGDDRLRWKSQWSGYNRMYYDTNVNYNHWPTLSNADPNSPRSHPMHAGNTLNLSGIYESVVSGGGTINITNAHYYIWSASESKPYLVIIDSGSIVYYEVNDDGDNVVEANELAPTATPPADVVTGRSGYAEERQNFANWYSFYRKRELTATAAIANVINSMQGVQIGLRGINGYDSDIIQPVHKIKVGGVDETSTLLNRLYNFDNQAYGTPLRRGLEAVGRYFHQDDGQTGGLGASPYAAVDDGGECQQAFAIVMTDGYWNGGAPLTGAIANNDGDDSSAYDGAAPHGDEPYGDTYFDTLADVAMYYYENDLSTTLGPEVPQNPWDDNQQQHMVTYGVSFGVTGTLDPSAYDFISTFPIWPSPTAGNKQKIDDLWHASVNGRGFFLSASNPNELVNSLLEIMQNIEEREGSASSVSVNGDELYTKLSGGGDILMFQSSYDTENWTGDVKAYQVCTALTGNCAGKQIGDIIKSPYVWSANEKLEGLNWNTGRKIVTYNGTDEGKPFRWGDLTTDQQTALNNDSTLLDYLRGDASNEVANLGSFRDRFARLGDMVHSSPTFENGVLYAGGNNGMLHAFAAADGEPSGAVGGEELFAYVPNLVFDNLSQLADLNYTHKYFVDLTPTVKAGVDISGVSTTMLVGGLGKGGRGYYALDVTDPTSWTSEGAIDDTVMWEYPKAGVTDDDMGYSFSKPAIIESNDDDVNGGSGWIVIFGNGYNSQNGHAVLYVLNPETGVIIRKIDTGVDGCNGLSTAVPIDVDYDNKVDYVYAGDLRGNVWKFDLTDSDYTNWEVAFYDGEEKPLFQAQGPGGTTQPITAKPDIMYHPTEHGYMVLFGTGQYLGESDISDTTAQSFYGIWDYGDDEDDSEYLGYFRRGFGQELSNQPNTVSLLAQQVIPSESPDPNAPNFWTVTINGGQPDEYDLLLRLTTDHDIVWETVSDGNNTPITDPLDDLSDSVDNHAGWYFDLPLSGERGTVDMMIRGGVLIAISFIPEDSPCGYGGSSVIHEINATSGARLTRPQFDINGDGVIDDDDMINIGTALNPIWVVPSGMKKSGQLQPPAILIDPEGDVEIKYFSSSSGTIEMVYEKPPLLGISHWREFE